MLDINKLKASEALKDLPEDKLQAIASMSETDETLTFKTKIGDEVGAMHGKYEADIKEATGIEKVQGEKSFVYMKRAFSILKDNQISDDVKTKITSLETQNKELNQTIKSGNISEAVKAQMLKQDEKIELLTNTLSENQTKFSESLKGKDTEVFNTRFDIEQSKSMGEIALNNSIPEAARNQLKENAFKSIKDNYESEFMSLNGKDVLVFKKENTLLTNADGSPKSLTNLVSENLGDMVAKKDGKNSGSGNEGGKGNSHSISLLEAKSKSAADDIITDSLLAEGLDYASTEFHMKKMEIKKENAEFIKGLE